MQTLTWYWNRVGRMSAGEIAWRMRQAVQGGIQRVWVATDVPEMESAAGETRFVRAPRGMEAGPYVQAAERILAGKYRVFDLEECELGDPPQWNRDPRSGKVAELVAASALDYRDERKVGDIKSLWEPNRHLHLVTLAQAYALTVKTAYAREVGKQVDSWIAQCPVGRGPNWASGLELGIRLINWSLAWQLLGGAGSVLFEGEAGAALRERWLKSVFQQARAVAGNLSRFSSANNHLIGEAAGVWIASVTWPHWPQLRRWGLRCRAVLEREIVKQNAPDGGNREQALSYQQFVLDFLLLSALAGRAAGEEFSPAYWARLEKMILFLADMSDVGGNVPMIGDADDGYAVGLGVRPDFCRYRSLMATGAVLFGRDDLAAKAGGVDAKTQWLLSCFASSALRRPAAQGVFKPRRVHEDSGYYLLGERFETADEVRMLVDAGPLGYLSLAAHGHADALSVLLNVGGHEVLIDPGTYAYHTEPQWRRYFRGTRAHNTVTVDGQDQSGQSGNFMWARHAHARCLDFSVAPEEQRFAGEHDGYAGLPDPLTHWRCITYDPAARSFEIVDTLVCAGNHRADRHWHFSERLNPEVQADGGVGVQAGRFRVRIVPVEPVRGVRIHRGGTPEEGGWVSRRFGVKTPCATVVWTSDVHARTALRTRICVSELTSPGRGA